MSSEKGGLICGGICGAIVVILIATLPFIFTTTDDTEKGVVYSRIFARFSDEVLGSGGFHTKAYNADVIRWPRTEQTLEFGDSSINPDSDLPTFGNIICNSKDGLRIDLHISFQFTPLEAELLALTKKFQDYPRWFALMSTQALSSIHHVCGDFFAEEYQTIRGNVTATIEAQIRSDIGEHFGASVSKLQVRNVNRPLSYENAIRDKENARSEISLAQNERDQALTKAETVVDVAFQEKLRIENTAETNANITDEQGESQRDAIQDKFEELAVLYKSVMDRRAMSVNGILTYIASDIFATDITIAVDSPTETNFRRLT